MAFLGAPPLSGQVLGLWPDCCRDINVLLAGHPYYHVCERKKQWGRLDVFTYRIYVQPTGKIKPLTQSHQGHFDAGNAAALIFQPRRYRWKEQRIS